MEAVLNSYHSAKLMRGISAYAEDRVLMYSRILKKQKDGFALAELLVVIAILGILSGITFAGVQTIRKNLRFTEMNESAREIYIAAQNQLTYANVNGSLDQALDTLTAGMQESGDIPVSGSADGSYYYLYNTGNQSNSDTWKEILLPYGSVDEAVRNGSWIIEFDAKNWNIAGVYYSGSEDNIAHHSEVFDFSANMQSDSADLLEALHKIIRDKNRDAQKHFAFGSSTGAIIGYYGGSAGTASPNIDPVNPVDQDEVKLKAPTLSVTNGNILWLNIQVPMSDAEINAADARLVVSVRGQSSGETAALALTLQDLKSRENKVSLTMDGQSGKTTFLVDKEISTGNTQYYHLILDDITAGSGNTSFHFTDLFSNLFPGENVSISAKLESTKVLSGVKDSNTVETNSLFADADAQNQTVQIASFRHLENLNQDISGLNIKKLIPDKSAGLTIEQTADLAWKEFISERKMPEGLDRSGSGKGGVGSTFAITAAGNSADKTENSYVPVNADYPLTYHGNKHEISDMICTVGGSAGLFGVVSKDLSADNVYLDNTTIAVKAADTKDVAGTLIGTVNGAKVNVVDVLISSDMDKLRSDKAADQNEQGRWLSSVTSSTAGGVIGAIDSGTVRIKNTASTAVVGGADYAGGLIGRIGSNAAVDLTNSYVGGHTSFTDKGELVYDYDDKDPSSANIYVTFTKGLAGGVIGKSDDSVSVNACYSTASVASKTADADHANSFANLNVGASITAESNTLWYGSGDVNGSPWADYASVGAERLTDDQIVPEHPFDREYNGKKVQHVSHVVSVKALGGDMTAAPWFIAEHIGDWTDISDKEEIYTVTFHDHEAKADESPEENLFKGRDSDLSKQQVVAGDGVMVIPELNSGDSRILAKWYWDTGEKTAKGESIYGVYDCLTSDDKKREYFILGKPTEASPATASRYTAFEEDKENKLTQVLSNLDVYPIYESTHQQASFMSVNETSDGEGNSVRNKVMLATEQIADDGTVQVPAFRTIPGYKFDHWYRSEDRGAENVIPDDKISWGTKINASDTLGTDLTGYAWYDRIKTYKITIQFRSVPAGTDFTKANDGSAIYWDLVYKREKSQSFKETIPLPKKLLENYASENISVYAVDSNGNIVSGANTPELQGSGNAASLNFADLSVNTDATYVVVFKGSAKKIHYTIQYKLRNSGGSASIAEDTQGNSIINTDQLQYADYASNDGTETGAVYVKEILEADKDSVVMIQPLPASGFHVIGNYPQYKAVHDGQTITVEYDRDSSWIFYDLAGGTYTTEDGKVKSNIDPTRMMSGQTIYANPTSTDNHPQIAEPTGAVRAGCWLPHTEKPKGTTTVTGWYNVEDTDSRIQKYKTFTTGSGPWRTTYYYDNGSWWYDWYKYRKLKYTGDKVYPADNVQCIYTNGKWQWQIYGRHEETSQETVSVYDQPIWRFYTEEDYNKAKDAMEAAKTTAQKAGQEVDNNDYNILTYLKALESDHKITAIQLDEKDSFRTGAGNYYAVLDWQMPKTASVKVELFLQEVNDDQALTSDAEKKYYYYATLDGPELTVESTPTLDQFTTQYSANALSSQYPLLKHFTLSSTRSVMKAVKPDGSTVVRLYYNRNKVTIHFLYNAGEYSDWWGYSYGDGGEATWIGLYQADFKHGIGTDVYGNAVKTLTWPSEKSWYDVSAYPDSIKNIKTNGVNGYANVTTLTFLAQFADSDYEDIYLIDYGINPTESSGTSSVAHYQESIADTSLTTRDIYNRDASQITYNNGGTTFNFSNKYLGYTVFWSKVTYGKADKSQGGDRREDSQLRDAIDSGVDTISGTKKWLDNQRTLNIYYRRNTQKILLHNATISEEQMAAYNRTNSAQPLESSDTDGTYIKLLYKDTVRKLPGKNDISRPSGLSDEYSFAGWTESAASDATPITDADGNLKNPFTMEYYDRQLFAKWVLPEVKVTLHNVSGPEQDTTAESSVEEYSMYSPDNDQVLNAPEGYQFGGWYTDQKFTVPYVATQITENLDLYARWIRTSGIWQYHIRGFDVDTGEEIKDFPEVSVDVNLGGTLVTAPTTEDYPDNAALKGYYPVMASVSITPTEEQINDPTKRFIDFYYQSTDPWSYSVAYHINGIGTSSSTEIRVPKEDQQGYIAGTASEESTTFIPDVSFLNVTNGNDSTLMYITKIVKTDKDQKASEVNDGYLILNRADDGNCRIDVYCSLDFSSLVNDVQKTYDGTALAVDEKLKQLLTGSDLKVVTKYYDKSGKELTGAPTDAGTYTARVAVYYQNTDSSANLVWSSGTLKANVYRRTIVMERKDGTIITDGEGSQGFAAGEGAEYTLKTANAFTYTLNDNTKAGNYNIIRKFG